MVTLLAASCVLQTLGGLLYSSIIISVTEKRPNKICVENKDGLSFGIVTIVFVILCLDPQGL